MKMQIEYDKGCCYETIVEIGTSDFPSKCRYDDEKYVALKNRISALQQSVLLECDVEDIFISNRLLWECDNVMGIRYRNTDNPYLIESETKKADWKLWDIQAERGILDGSMDQGTMSGWTNSYNNERFSDEEIQEYKDNIKYKIQPYMGKDKSALEIGIGSGLVSDELSLLFGSYDGCDFSAGVLEKLKENNNKKGITNQEHYCIPADRVAEIGKEYDVVLSSSVTEYFSGYNYLRLVIQASLCVVRTGGCYS